LNRPADRSGLGSFARYGVHVLLKADRKIDLRLTENPSESEGKQPGECPREHTSDQKRPHQLGWIDV